MKKIVIVILSLCALTQYTMYGAKKDRSQQNTPATTSSSTTTTQQKPACDPQNTSITISFKDKGYFDDVDFGVRDNANKTYVENINRGTPLIVQDIKLNTPYKMELRSTTGAISILPFTPTSCGQTFNVAISGHLLYFADKPTSTLTINVLNPKKLMGRILHFYLKEPNKPAEKIGSLNLTQTPTKKILTIPELSTNDYTLSAIQDETSEESSQAFKGAKNVNFKLFLGKFGDQTFYTLYQ